MSASSSSPYPQTQPSLPSALHQLSSPVPTLIDSQLPGYLVPSVLDALRESSRVAVRRQREWERSEGPLTADSVKGKAKQGEGDQEEEEQVKQALRNRIEAIGLVVGGTIAERLSLSKPPLPTHLDVIKFVCKDLFLHLYARGIDNLRTNHRGVFVLQSHVFPPLVPLSNTGDSAALLEAAKLHMLFPQAIIQGALGRLGLPAVVVAETSGLPQCTFQIKTVKPQPPVAGSGFQTGATQTSQGQAMSRGTGSGQGPLGV